MSTVKMLEVKFPMDVSVLWHYNISLKAAAKSIGFRGMLRRFLLNSLWSQ